MIHKIKEIQSCIVLNIFLPSGSMYAPLLWREVNAYSLICQAMFCRVMGFLRGHFFAKFSSCCV